MARNVKVAVLAAASENEDETIFAADKLQVAGATLPLTEHEDAT